MSSEVSAKAEIGKVAQSLPTPLARAALRVERDRAETVQTFMALSYLAEAYFKYSVLVLHSAVSGVDRTAWQWWGYRLSRADGLGDWIEAFDGLEKTARLNGIGGWVRRLIDWMSIRRSGRDEVAWFSESFDTANELWSLLEETPLSLPRTVKGVLGFLVSFRNKTRGHGASSREFYRKATPIFEFLLARVLAQSSAFEATLALRESQANQSVIRRLVGPVPSFVEKRPELAGEEGLVLLSSAGDEDVVPFSPLLSYLPESDESFFANGSWRPGDKTAEGLDYATGRRSRLSLSPFATPPGPRPRSETAGRNDFVEAAGAWHNLPVSTEGYVQRKGLESQLVSLLEDKQHRIVTLHGMGGVGKTTLALRSCEELVSSGSCPFDLIVWFSARDVDLLDTGPQKREREVSDLQQIAELYWGLWQSPERGQAAVDLFSTELIEGTNRVLLVMDNFETLDDPEGVHEYLDQTVVLPNKVLVTSRLKTFRGDFPLEVRGMEFPEADELLHLQARRIGAEPKLTPAAVEQIYDHTSGIPYAMKLTVAQLGRGILLRQILEAALGDDQVLDALFLRSYRDLSANARRLFLLVANRKGDVPVLPLRVVCAAKQVRFDAALDECERASLMELSGDELRGSIRMPHVAKRFGQRQLVSAEERFDVERDLDLITQTYQFSGASEDEAVVYARRLTGLIERTTDEESRADLLKVIDALGSLYPRTWLSIALLRLKLEAAPDSVREAFERAVQEDPDNSAAWQEWAGFEGAEGNRRREVELLIRAAEADEDDLGLNSHAAARLAKLISNQLEAFPLDARARMSRGLMRNLEKHFDRLEANPLSRLGWLYYLLNDRGKALRCARRGLELDPEHEHCRNIVKRVGSEK